MTRPIPRSSALTHPGTVRPRNEDAFLDGTALGLWSVADGAGGHGGGEIASQAVIESLAAIPPGLSAGEILAQLRLRLAAAHAGLQSRSLAEGRDRPMASTVVVLLLRDSHYAVLWAGDSRIYLLRDGLLRQLTRDHSLVQELVDAGALTREQAEEHPQANVITRAIGAEGDLQLDKASAMVAPGDRFLLCSDGLFKALPEPAIAGLMAAGADAEGLVQAAVEQGARDNVTALVVSL